MKKLNRPVLTAAIATAITFGGSFAGLLPNAYADEAPAAAASSSSSSETSTPATVTDPQALANSLQINLYLDRLATFTDIAANIDSDSGQSTALDAVASGQTLEQFAMSTGAFTGVSDYLNKLEALTNENVDFELNTGNLTADQANAIKSYTDGVIAKAVVSTTYVEQ
ncbi:hypothetical protein [Paenibacillus cremeus]|uniref:Uncharacterized protein n=1 Tax=Paenibacillus cremeus TaxID=2163881 RepID=A0A559KG37_9BACL|nr:hypothetical protein [Paenibacillus cremeus]TVY11085.1 hypothetical protein FPZ49_04355 [Paenibacillus cremeus]